MSGVSNHVRDQVRATLIGKTNPPTATTALSRTWVTAHERVQTQVGKVISSRVRSQIEIELDLRTTGDRWW